MNWIKRIFSKKKTIMKETQEVNKLRVTLLCLIVIFTTLMLMSCETNSEVFPIPQGVDEYDQNTIQNNVWMESRESRYVIYNFSDSTFTKINGIWEVGESSQEYSYQANESVIIYGNDTQGDFTKEYQIVADTLWFEGHKLIKIN